MSYCPSPAVVSNGFVTSSGPYVNGSKAWFACSSGFSMTGSPGVQCFITSTGNQTLNTYRIITTWLGSTPNCTAIANTYITNNNQASSTIVDPNAAFSQMLAYYLLGGLMFLLLLGLVVALTVILCKRRHGGCCSNASCSRWRSARMIAVEEANNNMPAQPVTEVKQPPVTPSDVAAMTISVSNFSRSPKLETPQPIMQIVRKAAKDPRKDNPSLWMPFKNTRRAINTSTR